MLPVTPRLKQALLRSFDSVFTLFQFTRCAASCVGALCCSVAPAQSLVIIQMCALVSIVLASSCASAQSQCVGSVQAEVASDPT